MKRNDGLKMLGALIASVLISAPTGFAQNGLSIQTARPIRLTVAPKASSAITMKTIPQATCVLHAEGATDAEHQLKLFADDEGIVRFHVRPSAETDKAAHFQVDCAADGKINTFPLHLRSSSLPTADMPPPPAEMEIKKVHPGASVRAALTNDEALNLGSDELANRGYPLRPDQDKAPEAFGAWLKAVTKPARFVAPRLVPRLEVTHSPRVTNAYETSNNWSGFELRGGNNYDWVMGEWYVPSVSYETNRHVYSAYWIGLDGDGTSDLVQAGTEQEITDIVFWGSHFDFTSYYGWTEFLPQQPTEQVISNFTVNPGDLILTQVWVGNPGSSASLAGAYGIFSVENVSRSEYTTIYTSRCNASIWGICLVWTNVGGTEAEWIMERPTVNGALPDLANYGTTYMYNSYAHISNAGPYFMNYDGATYQQISMYNGSDLLSTTWPVTSSTMGFSWYNFH